MKGTGENGRAGEGGWLRVHRATPLVRAWLAIVALVGSVVSQIGLETLGSLARAAADRTLLLAATSLGVLAAATAMLWAVSGIWWRATGYRIGEDEVALRRGVITRSQRTARYDRVQAIDVVEPLVPRLFGLAALRIETAGGGNSVLEIAYLKKAVAERLRARIVDRLSAEAAPAARAADGVEAAGGEATAPGAAATPSGDHPGPPAADRPVAGLGTRETAAGAPPPEEVLLPEIPIGRTLFGALLSWNLIAPTALIAAAFVIPIPEQYALIGALALVSGVWRIVDRSWRFGARRVGGRAEVSFGLANRRRQSIPLDRVHAVRIAQPTLWRLAGWWRVDVNIAGYGDSVEGSTTTVVPIAPLPEARRAVGRLAGFSLDPECPRSPSFASPARARWLSPLDWARQQVLLSDDRATVWWGWVRRRAATVETGHIQEVSFTRGPLERLFRVATVRMDLVPGSVTMIARQLDIADARELVARLAERRLPSPDPLPTRDCDENNIGEESIPEGS